MIVNRVIALLTSAIAVMLPLTEHGRAVWPDQDRGVQTEAELRDRIITFVAKTVAEVPLDKIAITELSAPDQSGIRTALIHLGEGTDSKEQTLYLTADGKDMFFGTLIPWSEDPWQERREKLDAMIAGAPTTGSTNATVTIVEFADFQCPYCADEETVMEELLKEEPRSVRWVFMNFPLKKHSWAMPAAIAGACVAKNNPAQFWAFARRVYETQKTITDETVGDSLRRIAVDVGTEETSYDVCIRSRETADALSASVARAQELGVSGTPATYINGRHLQGLIALDVLKSIVDNENAIAVTARNDARR